MEKTEKKKHIRFAKAFLFFLLVNFVLLLCPEYAVIKSLKPCAAVSGLIEEIKGLKEADPG